MPLLETKGAASAQGFGLTLQRSGAVQADAIDFDGTNDLLSRSTDLTGNTDSQSFTLSFWLWRKADDGLAAIYTAEQSAGVTRFSVYVQGSTTTVEGYDSGGTLRLNVSFNLGGAQYTGTFYHVLVSVNKTSTATRSVYVNDVLQSATWNTYSTTNNIDFTTPLHSVMGLYTTTATAAGRLSNLFLDKTYRDMSITANRRLFVTADLKPAAGQAALNPILYLPMSDPTAPGLNTGTGGNFTLTGVVARSGRGPNQYNAPYSDLDGSADYLNRSSIVGIADGKQLTISWCGSVDTGGNYVFSIGTSTDLKLYFNMVDGSGRMQFLGFDAAGNNRLNGITPTDTIAYGRNYVITISVDLTDTAKRHVYINGEAISMTWTAYSAGADLDFTANVNRVGLGSTGTNYFDGRLGALWFNTSYIDLSVAANLAKFVTGTGINAAPVDLGASGELPTGTSPLIYLPMYGNDAGKNYGTGGDFTVNSGPYTGARGPNEFWGNWAVFNGSTSYLTVSNTAGLSNTGKTVSFVATFSTANFSAALQSIFGADSDGRLRILTDGRVQFVLKNTSGADAINVVTTGSVSNNTTYTVFCSIDTSSASNRYFSLNGSTSVTWSTYLINSLLRLSTGNSGNMFGVGVAGSGASAVNPLNGKIAELYVTDQYIDFSQEANRLKFRDAFGNPVNLTQQIEAAAIPNPAIYMRFPPTSFGTNSGTGGNFTVNGTITDGGQL